MFSRNSQTTYIFNYYVIIMMSLKHERPNLKPGCSFLRTGSRTLDIYVRFCQEWVKSFKKGCMLSKPGALAYSSLKMAYLISLIDDGVKLIFSFGLGGVGVCDKNCSSLTSQNSKLLE